MPKKKKVEVNVNIENEPEIKNITPESGLSIDIISVDKFKKISRSPLDSDKNNNGYFDLYGYNILNHGVICVTITNFNSKVTTSSSFIPGVKIIMNFDLEYPEHEIVEI